MGQLAVVRKLPILARGFLFDRLRQYRLVADRFVPTDHQVA